jgi:hypothetical protein
MHPGYRRNPVYTTGPVFQLVGSYSMRLAIRSDLTSMLFKKKVV